MSQLSAPSIERLCTHYLNNPFAAKGLDGQRRPLIHPFTGMRTIVNGKSYGLSAASYDLRIGETIRLPPGRRVLTHTLEEVAIPINVAASVADKSSWARQGISAFNTFFDPGFVGRPTLELVNHSNDTIEVQAGDPICQLIFHWLDQPTDRPYAGKYQFQDGTVESIHEGRHT